MKTRKQIDTARDQMWLQRVVEEVMNGHWYGQLVIKFQEGRPVHVEKHESLLPPTGRKNC